MPLLIAVGNKLTVEVQEKLSLPAQPIKKKTELYVTHGANKVIMELDPFVGNHVQADRLIQELIA